MLNVPQEELDSEERNEKRNNKPNQQNLDFALRKSSAAFVNIESGGRGHCGDREKK